MSCWVVPTVAAELWDVSVEHVMSGIRDGSIPSKIDNGFVCVDAAPGSPRLSRSRANRPPTFAAVTDAEMTALLSEDAQDEEADCKEDDGDPVETGTIDWRDARLRNGRLRRAPKPARVT